MVIIHGIRGYWYELDNAILKNKQILRIAKMNI